VSGQLHGLFPLRSGKEIGGISITNRNEVRDEIKTSIYIADHSPPSSVKDKNAWTCTSTHPYVFMATYIYIYCGDFSFQKLGNLSAFQNIKYGGKFCDLGMVPNVGLSQ
jgi:hypothetical protein